MNKYVGLGLMLAFCIPLAKAQSLSPGAKSPREIVDELWTMATRGELLSVDGLKKAPFSNPTPVTNNKVVRVVSNYWGPAYQLHSDQQTAEIAVGYTDMGTIDSELRYTAPPKTDAIKTALTYRLMTVPAYAVIYAHDGKTILSKKATGFLVWQIEGSPEAPWTTVNTAIRYVLEVRAKSENPSIRKNADQTLAKLLRLH